MPAPRLDRKRQEAEAAMRASQADDLGRSREDAERLAKDAKAAEAEAEPRHQGERPSHRRRPRHHAPHRLSRRGDKCAGGLPPLLDHEPGGL